MTVRQIQYGLAAVFFILGGWAMLAPRHVIETVIRPEFQSFDRLTIICMACFGAQACLAGLFISFSRFTRTTFLAYGIALLPFFGFNYWFTRVEPIFNSLGLIDLVGNMTMLALCVYGWRQASKEDLTPSG
jgi:hypothetical protein